MTVRDVMHGRGEIAWAHPGDSLKQVVIAMTHFPHGAACVVDSGQRLRGLITDGDVRRALQAHDDIRSLEASAVMTVNPATIDPGARLQEALRLMEDRPSQISVLPVVDASGACLGLLRLHDLYRAGLRTGATGIL
jgi:arabinose-5-phosphate isomerase